MVQYSRFSNARISRSRSTISRSATSGRVRPRAAADLIPEQRENLVADQPVEHAAGLLRLDQVHVHHQRLLERLLMALAVISLNITAIESWASPSSWCRVLLQVIADRLAFAIGSAAR
jgi:hypothetical protein